MRKRDYILATCSLNTIVNSTMLNDIEHSDIILADGSSLKEFLKHLNDPQPPEEDTEDEVSSVVGEAIVDKSKTK